MERLLGETEGELIRRERQELSKKMGRAGVRCNDGEVTREAGERWRERRGNKERCHVSFMLRGRTGGRGNKKSELKYITV